jgi:4-amino-4-deoxy-L-arabinose transferase-like glycosyltransferase
MGLEFAHSDNSATSSLVLADPMSAPRFFKPRLIILAIILAIGIFLRLPPELFQPNTGPLQAIESLHPRPDDQKGGYDERLYEAYAKAIGTNGLTSYPDIVRAYLEKQKTLPGSILPPLRFLYIFSAYLYHALFSTPERTALHYVSSIFSVLTLLLSAVFVSRLRRSGYTLGVTALMAVAPTQLHMSQHGLIDGFFTFWAMLALWSLWESLRSPHDWRWLALYVFALCGCVITKENAFFVWIAFIGIIVANRWLAFGVVTRETMIATVLGPLLGVAVLLILAGGVGSLIETYALSVSKNYTLDYAIQTGDGPWYRYLVDLLLVSPVVLLLAIGAVFTVRREQKVEWFFTLFIAMSYLIMCNIKYGMNLRYANMWDLPLRVLAFSQMRSLSRLFPRAQNWLIIGATSVLCLIEFHQYIVLAVNFPLYELATQYLMYALKILKLSPQFHP